MRIYRRFSLTDERAVLQFCAKPANEFSPIASMVIELIPQKGAVTALNCFLDSPDTKEQKNFRMLICSPEEAEPQILKILTFIQKAFQPHKYNGQAKTNIPTAEAEQSTLETAQNLVSSAGTSAAAVATAPVAAPAAVVETLSPEAAAITHGKKYLVNEGAPDDGVVRMRTYDGKYVPEGDLPATIKVNK